MNVSFLTSRWWKPRRPETTVTDPDAQVSLWKHEWLAGASAAWSATSATSNPHNTQRAGLEHAAWEAGFKWAGEHPDRRREEALRLAHPHRRASDAKLTVSLKRAAALGATGVALYAASRALRRWRGTAVIALALMLMGQVSCTNAAVDKAVGTATADPTVVVTRAERGVVVENRVGRPLLSIRVEIERSDNAAPFVYTLPTLDTAATREISFSEFRSEDGTLFDAGTAAPKQVKTTARDTLSNSYTTTTPWTPGQD